MTALNVGAASEKKRRGGRVLAVPKTETVRSPSTFLFLQPPYQTFKSISFGVNRHRTIPLATVALASAGTVLQSLCGLDQLVRRYHWIIPTITVSDDADAVAYIAQLIPLLKDRLVVVQVPSRIHQTCEGVVLRAVRRRMPPSPQSMASYAARRVGSRELGDILREQFAVAVQGDSKCVSRSVATCSRVFSRFGPLTARDWRAVARLAQTLGGYGGMLSQCNSSISSKTAVRHTHRYLGLSWTMAKERLGWEWVLERVLKREGYVVDGVRRDCELS